MLSKLICITGLLSSVFAAWTPTEYQSNVDNSTYANADQIHTTHLHVDWIVDFNAENLFASITHDLEVLESVDHVVFDSWLLDIIQCEIVPSKSARTLKDLGAYAENGIVGSDLDWTIDVVNPEIGDALTVHLD